MKTLVPQFGDDPKTIEYKMKKLRRFDTLLKDTAGLEQTDEQAALYWDEAARKMKRDAAKEKKGAESEEVVEEKTVVRTGKLPDGRKVIQYSDGSEEIQ